jgi:cobalamin biosynthesis Mg chelatase CobN
MLAVLAGALAAPAAAQADAFEDVFADYQKDAKIDPCAHSQAELRAAKGKVPNDIEQYAPDFPDALDEALEARARTSCAKPTGGAAAAVATTPTQPAPVATAPENTQQPETETVAGGATTVPQPPGTAQPAQAAADDAIVNAASGEADKGADDIPAPLIALAVLGAIVLLVLLVWGTARFFAWDPAWVQGSRHAIAEAGWRAGGLWDDFTDWLRPGRRGAS